MEKYKAVALDVEAMKYTGKEDSFKELTEFSNGKFILDTWRNLPYIMETGKINYVVKGDYVVKVYDKFVICPPDLFVRLFNTIIKEPTKGNKDLKVGSRVRVMGLCKIDKDETYIKVGDVGEIISEFKDNEGGDSADVFNIVFDRREIVCMCAYNRNLDGSYGMFRSQLEEIE